LLKNAIYSAAAIRKNRTKIEIMLMLSAVLSIYFPFSIYYNKNADFLYGFPQGQIRKKRRKGKCRQKKNCCSIRKLTGKC